MSSAFAITAPTAPVASVPSAFSPRHRRTHGRHRASALRRHLLALVFLALAMTLALGLALTGFGTASPVSGSLLTARLAVPVLHHQASPAVVETAGLAQVKSANAASVLASALAARDEAGLDLRQAALAVARPPVRAPSVAPRHQSTPPRPVHHVRKPVRHHYHARASTRSRAYAWALRQQGAWYVWGGEGPGFDCSGLVVMSYLHAGIALPRTTYEMLGSWHLVPVSHAAARPGDLAFYGSGHVEMYVSWFVTYGAAHTGTQVGFHHWSSGWAPTGYYRVR